jgi:hypothetical protein
MERSIYRKTHGGDAPIGERPPQLMFASTA